MWTNLITQTFLVLLGLLSQLQNELWLQVYYFDLFCYCQLLYNLYLTNKLKMKCIT